MNWNTRILACTLFGEARGETVEGMEAVANVVINRLKDGRFGDTVQEVCLRPLQFSCWNSMASMQMLLSLKQDKNPTFATCVAISEKAIHAQLIDNTGGALFYHTLSVDPPWDDEMKETARHLHHIFYTDRRE